MIMISIPMGNNPNWREQYKEVKVKLEAQGYQVSPLTYKEMFGKRTPNFIEGLECQLTPLFYMAHAFYRMSLCDTIYMCKGWKSALGCIIEHEAAIRYGLNIIYEDEEDEN